MRSPEELYDTLCRRRQVYGRYGLCFPCTALTPPLERAESDALHDWLCCGAGPRDVGMIAALQGYWMDVYRAERAASAPSWRYVRRGRALHAFLPGSDAPVCGVRPVHLSTGVDKVWMTGHRGYGARRLREHAECSWRLRQAMAQRAEGGR